MPTYNDPLWGIDTIRDSMRGGRRGPTWGLVVLGLVMLVAGLVYGHWALALVGVVAAVIGAGPIVRGYATGQGIQRLAERGRLEAEIAGLARTAVTGSAGQAVAARESLRKAVGDEPGAAEGARKLCLENAADGDATASEWNEAAREIAVAVGQPGPLRQPERGQTEVRPLTGPPTPSP